MAYEDNSKAFFNSLRSNCSQGTSSHCAKRKFVVDTTNEKDKKRKKQMLSLNKQISETEKMLEEL